MISAQDLWAKLRRCDGTIVAWHSLVDHSADVAAVLEALLDQPVIRRRLAGAGGLADLDATWRSRLAALAFLHDIGKANRGFRARFDPRAELVGHIHELSWVFNGERAEAVRTKLIDVLGLDRCEPWFAGDPKPLFEAVFAHHGRPWKRERGGSDALPHSLDYWQADNRGDPVADLAPMRAGLDRWFADAFRPGPPLPESAAFQHAFAGLLMLADWLGSDEDLFPFADGREPDRMIRARSCAQDALRRVGLAVEPWRAALRAVAPSFAMAFGFEPTRPIQKVVTEPTANLLVLEAETGSGKTEAALWRFKSLFEQGLVDGLYFALPTRVAATQIFERVKAFRDRVFPANDRPGVVLAVPGQARFDEAEAKMLPGFEVQWSDESGAADHARRTERWAAERPKRFLAATIAVGTIDQALLGSIAVKHAHLRATALLRHLLVADEVHASDVYMERLLGNLLRSHVQAGGHALLMSATLGATMRSRLLGTALPGPDEAAAVPYPALRWAEMGEEQRLPIECDARNKARAKAVAVEAVPFLQDPAAIAALALAAAGRGAAVLVIRNTVGAAVETVAALEDLAGADSRLLFRAAGIATVHHSRFALEDRRLLDGAVEARMGKGRRADDGAVVVGTQTLEISLDLDADLLICDLCPVDVLLQRIGRLHRHAERSRPPEFASPRVVVLVPPARDLLAGRLSRYGLGPLRDGDGIYPDLRMVEATWRLVERHATWDIPAMNRGLVEAATHPARLLAIEAVDPRWTKLGGGREANQAAKTTAADYALLDRTKPFDKCIIPTDERFATRLGAAERLVTFDPPRRGPFGSPATTLRMPAFLTRGIDEQEEPQDVADGPGFLSFRFGDAVFLYDRFGLRKMTSPASAGEPRPRSS